jgi:hypothetical protein
MATGPLRHCRIALCTTGLKNACKTVLSQSCSSTVPTVHWPGCFIRHSRQIILRSAYHKGSSGQQGPETSGSQGWPNSEARGKFRSRRHTCLKADTLTLPTKTICILTHRKRVWYMYRQAALWLKRAVCGSRATVLRYQVYKRKRKDIAVHSDYE